MPTALLTRDPAMAISYGVKVAALLVSLCVAIALAMDDDPATRLSRCWVDELGSRMRLTATPTGLLHGQYTAAVGTINHTRSVSIQGSWAPASALGSQALISFTVVWPYDKRGDAHSTAAWSGQLLQKTTGGKTTWWIEALWLLTTSQSPKSAWSATRVGRDRFVPCTSWK